MKLRSAWVRHGILNTLEHGVTRISDALVSLVLLWALSPEAFSKLALAQAAVAPLLLLFVAPEAVMYRDFGKWKVQGFSFIAERVRAYRIFSWGKGQVALAFSVVGAFAMPSGADSGAGVWTRFAALVWAFSLVLAPQISAPDRELLRLDLRLRELNFLSLYQKLVILGGSVIVLLIFPQSPIGWLAGVSVFSAMSSALLARRAANQLLLSQGADPLVISGRGTTPVIQLLKESFQGFSLWQHLAGVLLNWILTMDLFFLGIFHFPARIVGLYASVLKLGNLTTALPTALSNTFNIWVGRRAPDDNANAERQALRRLTFLLSLGSFSQAALLAIFAPILLRILSHGRWSGEEQLQMVAWFRWILLGGALFCSALLLLYWLALRTSIARLFKTFYLPWGFAAVLIYCAAAAFGNILQVAQANVAVSLIYIGFLALYIWRNNDQEKVG